MGPKRSSCVFDSEGLVPSVENGELSGLYELFESRGPLWRDGNDGGNELEGGYSDRGIGTLIASLPTPIE